MVDWPFVSVIMPVRNEEAFINRSLGSVLAQDYPSDRMEILVVDGMSTDATLHLVQALAPGQNLRIIENPGKIVPIGMNIAFHQAKGEIIARVDGHCEIAPDYIRQCVLAIQQDGVDGVGGAINTVGESWLAQGIAIAMSSTFGVGNSAFRTARDKTILADTVPFPVYSRATMERAGPYDEEQIRNQDDEYNYRLRKLGAKLLLSNKVHSRYFSRSSFPSLWRQYFGYGFWKVRVFQEHPRQIRLRQFIPPTFVAMLLGSSLLATFFVAGRILLGFELVAYFLANLSASILTAARCGWKYLPVLPLTYAILHISYGFGFLFGLIKFANRWDLRKCERNASTVL